MEVGTGWENPYVGPSNCGLPIQFIIPWTTKTRRPLKRFAKQKRNSSLLNLSSDAAERRERGKKMAEDDSKPNGVSTESEENPRLIAIEPMENYYDHREETLFGVLSHLFAAIFSPDPSASSFPLIQRLRNAFSEKSPSLKEATRNSTRKLLIWTRRGSALRAILVISVGTITLLALTGLMVFMLFFLAATVNAIVISLLMSLAAAGGFLAIFFACLTGIYIVALSVAIFVISTTTISTIIAVMITAGWIGFFWSLWLAANKGLDLTKHSLAMTGSAISSYSTSRHAHRRGLPNETK